MFDPKAAALLVLKKKGEDGEGEADDPSSSGEEALKSAYEAMKSGDFGAAYDAFHAAVQACMNEEGSESEGY